MVGVGLLTLEFTAINGLTCAGMKGANRTALEHGAKGHKDKLPRQRHPRSYSPREKDTCRFRYRAAAAAI